MKTKKPSTKKAKKTVAMRGKAGGKNKNKAKKPMKKPGRTSRTKTKTKAKMKTVPSTNSKNQETKSIESKSQTTTDHEIIRDWVSERDGHPAVVESTDEQGQGLLRIDFGEKNDSLEEIDWDKFFEVFDDRNLAFLFQEKTADGSMSRFFKFVQRS